MLALLLAVGLAPLALASYSANMVYRSPSLNHPQLAVPVHKLARRSLHSVVNHLAKRQVPDPEVPMDPLGPFPQTSAPSSGDGAYVKYAGADWTNAEYIYAGSVNFTHSVASGDPDDKSLILWTRAAPTQVAAVDVPVCVSYAVYTSADASGTAVTSGTAYTSYDVDFTVKVEATGLNALSIYYYQFANCAKPAEKSPIGRGRTAPSADMDAEAVGTQRFAVYSCSNLPFGFFNVRLSSRPSRVLRRLTAAYRRSATPRARSPSTTTSTSGTTSTSTRTATTATGRPSAVSRCPTRRSRR